MTDRVLAVACMPKLSHGAFRLYTLLAGAARQNGAEDGYFAVTLKGLMFVHPGIAGKSAGATTILKQVAELRKNDLIEVRAALHRNEPELPVLMKVLEPKDPTGLHRDIGAIVGTQ